jgi:cephalosporin hydroxylase
MDYIVKSLRDIFYNVPKFSDKWDRYFDVYERHLEKFRGKNITFLEVGVQYGGSLEMWSEYFGPETKIYGIDIDPNCANLVYDNPNIKIIIGDQSSKIFWDQTLKEIGPIDVMIEDGGHTMEQQIISFEKAFPMISSGGVYVCEDTHTSYWGIDEYGTNFGGGYKNMASFVEYSKNYADVLHYNFMKNSHGQIAQKNSISKGLSGVSFYDSMIIFEKEPRVEMVRVNSKRIV